MHRIQKAAEVWSQSVPCIPVSVNTRFRKPLSPQKNCTARTMDAMGMIIGYKKDNRRNVTPLATCRRTTDNPTAAPKVTGTVTSI